MPPSKRKRVLDYHDVLLYDTDVDLLEGPNWLNDQIIAFYFEYLEREKFKGNADICFLNGSVTYLILNGDAEDLKSMLAPLKLSERRLISLACNDNDDVHVANGGSHWSLLVYDRQLDMFVHYDSVSGSCNEKIARKVAAKVWATFGNDPKDLQFGRAAGPKQRNTYDCGLYVLAEAEQLASWYSEHGDLLADLEVRQMVTPEAVSNLRGDISRLVKELSHKPGP